MIRDYIQEVAELGAMGTAFRAAWEVRSRLGWLDDGAPPSGPVTLAAERLPFSEGAAVRALLEPHVSDNAREALRQRANEACGGRVRCFSRWTADFGEPVDWYLNPRTGQRWPDDEPWPKALASASQARGDVKATWEIGRFPQAYDMVRAAVWQPSEQERLASALEGQIRDFDQSAPYGYGIHWASSQEVALRLVSWLFSYDVLLRRVGDTTVLAPLMARALREGAAHTERHIGYARHAVHNNHLLSEALLLLIAGVLLPDIDEADRYRRTALDVLTEQADRQFYPDGGYIQQSHNYQRLAMQVMLLACRFAETAGIDVPAPWRAALERSVVFLFAHQNLEDGRLPNYGFNDGGLPLLLSCCAYSDFRPTLQAASIYASGERRYRPGPWDEEAAWLLGDDRVAAAPLRASEQRSRSFAHSGHHVLRSDSAPGSFAAFRCGTLRDRFSQMDMLHLDIWWRSQNVIVDAGSYQYNADDPMNAHFMGTASHNTLTVDGQNQMRHHRRFKVLYWTEATLLEFQEDERGVYCAGEHYGYRRLAGGCAHRRSVLFVPPELWIVVDHVTGEGAHDLAVHWLGGPFPHRRDGASIVLETPEGGFSVGVCDDQANPLDLRTARGSDAPIEGWLSRHYGEREPVPSLRASRRAPLPATFISVLGPQAHQPSRVSSGYELHSGDKTVSFGLSDGLVTSWEVS